jgi:SAM-dependent methyltransferase
MAVQILEHYDRDYYRSHVERYLRRTRFTRHRLANVFGLLGDVSGWRVLDIGCGMGTFTIESSLRGAHAIGVDPSLAAGVTGRDLAARLGALSAVFVAGDAALLPLADGRFDAVICADLTEHLDDPTLADVLAEVARVLRPGGVLALYTPSPSHLFERLKARNWLLRQDPSHIGLRPMEELLEAVRRAGLEVVRAYYRPTHIPLFRVLEQVLARIPKIGGLFRRRICIRARKPT